MTALPLLLLVSIFIAAAVAAHQPMGPEGAAEPQWRPQAPQSISWVRVKRTPIGPPGFEPPGPPGWSGLTGIPGSVRGLPGLATCQTCIKPCEILVHCKCYPDLQCLRKELIKSSKTLPLPPYPPLPPLTAAAPTTTPAADMTTTTARIQLLPCPQKCHKLGENGVCVENLNCLSQADQIVTSPATSTESSHNTSETWEPKPQSNFADRLHKVFIPHLLLSASLLVVWL